MKRVKKMGKRRMLFGCISGSEKFNALPNDQSRLLYLLSYLHTDDFGRICAEPTSIRLNVCPGLDYTNAQIEEYLASLHESGLVFFYSVGGKKYMEFADFDVYQSFKRERVGSCPEPEADIRSKSGNLEHSKSSKSGVFERKGKGSEVKGSEEKVKHRDDVWLTKDEYQSLLTKHGEVGVERMIELLDNYKGANGKKYKSDYKALLGWPTERWEKERPKDRYANIPKLS